MGRVEKEEDRKRWKFLLFLVRRLLVCDQRWRRRGRMSHQATAKSKSKSEKEEISKIPFIL